MQSFLRCVIVLCTLTSTQVLQVLADDSVTLVDRPETRITNAHYISNRVPLKPSALIKLPVGSITPAGWLLEYHRRQRDGLTGQLGNISAWLQKEGNAWLAPDGRGEFGWEEVPYWLKGYGNLAYILDDPAMIAETKIWVEAALNSQRPDGSFGPQIFFDDDQSQDFWGNMIMLFCLQSYYEHSNDPRVIDCMTKYFDYQLTIPDEKFLTHYWQKMRGGDNLYSVYWLYNRTGNQRLLELAEKIHRNTINWKMVDTLPNWHNVNIAQAFGEPATFYLQSHNVADLRAAYDNHRTIRRMYGQVPGGMFGSDENSRPGFDDPRQGVETCGMVEQMLSDETLLRITGDPMWADHCEEVAFNTYPAAVMPDFRSLRYITCPNMVVSDRQNHSPGIQNAGPFLMMNPFSSRCCQHNHSHGWPYFCENLWLATPDNGLCAALYAASKVKATVGDGKEILITEESNYPFEETLRFQIETSADVEFPLYFRIPSWCKNASVSVGGKEHSLKGSSGRYVRCNRVWKSGDTVTLNLPMQLSLRTWKQNHNSVSVDYGPLTFSLKIKERYDRFESDETATTDSKWQPDADRSKWPSFEIHPESDWNYGLLFDADQIEQSFQVKKHPWPKDNFPFTTAAAPISIETKGKRIPQWTIDKYGLCGVLQDSPVRSDAATESITLIPMGAARLRISAFPVIGDGPDAVQWEPTETPHPFHPTASHCFHSDTVKALCDEKEPKSSSDHDIPRITFWNHLGTSEWVQYEFDQPRSISSSSVYWFDDTGIGQCRIPASWNLEYRQGDRWQRVETNDSYGTAANQFNRIEFKPIETRALRLNIQLPKEFSAGILEWKFDEAIDDQ